VNTPEATKETMRALVITEHGGPEVLRVQTIPRPEPGPLEVRIRVRACALNHLDLWVRRGVPGAPFHLPITPGSDVAGDVDALGPGANAPPVGTRVMVAPGVSCGSCMRCAQGHDHLCKDYGILGETRTGGMAEYVVVPQENVVAMPERFDYVSAASVNLTFLTAWHMLVDRAGLQGGEVVLVQAGGSGVGSAAIQIARYLGARVITTVGSQEKSAAALKLGAHHTINYRQEDFAAEVKALTEGRGADVVAEHVGGETFERSLKALAWGGRLVTCGATTGNQARINLTHLFFKSQSVLGSTMGSRGEYHQLVRLYGEGYFEPVIDRVLSLDDIAEGHRVLEAREAFGKVVITP